MELVLKTLLIVTLLICLYTDLKERTIYNKVLLPTVLAGLILQGLLNGFPGIVFALKGFVVGLGLLFIPFAMGGIGAGDVKLMGLIGLYLGWQSGLYAGMLGILLGGGFSLLWLLKREQLGQAGRNIWGALKMTLLFRSVKVLQTLDQTSEDEALPYGVPLVIATLVVILMGW